jgi:hypothetical protein
MKMLAAVAFWMILWLSRAPLEYDMAVHMTVQMPLLVCVGLLLASVLRPREPRWLVEADWLGIPGLLAVVLATSFWMLPRMLDAALANPLIDLVKFVVLPLLAGLPLGLSWHRLPGLGRAFLWANFIAKLGAVGGLYLGAPTRVCAYYRLDQQAAAGWTLIAVATALGLLWFIAAFVGSPSNSARGGSARASCEPSRAGT